MIAGAANAQTAADERFLVPIYLTGSVDGAYNSLWVSELLILNTGASTRPICRSR